LLILPELIDTYIVDAGAFYFDTIMLRMWNCFSWNPCFSWSRRTNHSYFIMRLRIYFGSSGSA